MSTTPLSTDFKDDILASANPKRKYQMIYNDDGSVSFTDVTQYDQTGSIFGAKEVNEERAAINNIDERRLVTLDEIDLVTEEGYFVDAKAVAALNRKIDDAPVMLAGKMNLYYKSSSQMTGSASVDSKFNGCKVLVSVQSVEGTPYTGSYTWNVTGIVSGGKLTIDAWGAGFVSDHVLSASYLLVV